MLDVYLKWPFPKKNQLKKLDVFNNKAKKMPVILSKLKNVGDLFFKKL